MDLFRSGSPSVTSLALAVAYRSLSHFSLGLALTMVASGVVDAWSVQHAQKRFKGFGELMRKAPYLSVVILLVVAAFIGLQAWHALSLQTR